MKSIHEISNYATILGYSIPCVKRTSKILLNFSRYVEVEVDNIGKTLSQVHGFPRLTRPTLGPRQGHEIMRQGGWCENPWGNHMGNHSFNVNNNTSMQFYIYIYSNFPLPRVWVPEGNDEHYWIQDIIFLHFFLVKSIVRYHGLFLFTVNIIFFCFSSDVGKWTGCFSMVFCGRWMRIPHENGSHK